MIDIRTIYATQNRIDRRQVVDMIETAYKSDRMIMPVLIGVADDGTMQVEDGHHRLFAYMKLGRTQLHDHEYRTTLCNYRPRKGTMLDFYERNKL